MNHEIRLRAPRSFYLALSSAAAIRGVAVSALVSMVTYEYLRERGELTPTQARAVEPAVTSSPDLAVWFDEDDEPLNVGS